MKLDGKNNIIDEAQTDRADWDFVWVGDRGNATVYWPWTEWSQLNNSGNADDTDPEELGIIADAGGEPRTHGLDDRPVQYHHHLITMYSNLKAPEDYTKYPASIIENITEDDGMVYFAHHGDYDEEWGRPLRYYSMFFDSWTPEDGLLGLSGYTKYSPDPRETSWDDWSLEGSWDALLSKYSPDFAPVFLLEDDCDSFDNQDWDAGAHLRWTELIMDQEVWDGLGHERPPEVKEMFKRGQFICKYRTSWDVDPPEVHSIDVDENAGTVTIDASNYDSIDWVSYDGKVVESGDTLDYGSTSGVIGYFRARVYTEDEPLTGTLTQAFTIGGDGTRMVGSKDDSISTY
ncbi:hypothetical protein [Natronococcus roseus]|uniref:hypothetical protein n=1 Tax=Natronococcus roseus TaxID=1052014 RepID=UPI00374DB47A